MKPYRLLILGHVPKALDWASAEGVFQMLTFGLFQGFRTVPHVTLYAEHVRDLATGSGPEVDCVLVNCFSAEDPPLDEIRQKTGAKLVASIRENPAHYDHSFVFAPFPEWPSTMIRLPCCKAMMQNVPKVPGSLLVDHTWYVEDHTAEIEGWLEGYSLGPVYRLIRGGTENHPIPSWMQPIHYAPYPEYLRRTETFERHIITHIEGYPFGVVDFAARGTQVLTPPGLIPESMIADLEIPVFHNKEELRAILEKPVGEEWNRKIDLCTDYSECAKIIDQWFQDHLAS